ncbi:putative annexin anxc4 protein [Phaeoacremonium minimum UCRPA7]|uniref:Putative annexin anxc4 protein n=1 Tax=Phaeoacremonium minimum (strain UCR-PA7) TaxID=1286976 RepID=R8B9H3_PHAM7|nr:putative annexin anxc4 protein [Phaeoacremonium minimum UCRPA7]EON95932.1 putative annexin anxc4 protein [Phaeoacremonium minimum UCRPA7]
MSLQVDDDRRRGRSRSPSGRERDRSRGPPLVVDTDPDDRYRRGADRDRDQERDDPRDRAISSYADYDDRRSSYRPPPSPTSEDPYYRRRRDDDDDPRASYSASGGRREKEYRYEKETRSSKRDSDRDSDRDRDRDRDREKDRALNADAFLPQKYAKKLQESDAMKFMTAPSGGSRDRSRSRDRRNDKYEEDLAYGSKPSPPSKYARPESPQAQYSYDKPKQWEYARPEEKLSYSKPEDRHGADSLDPRYGRDPRDPRDARAPSPGPERRKKYYRESLGADPRGSDASVVTVEPGQTARRSAMKRSSSPQPPTAKMSSLSVGAPMAVAGGLAAAPGSPLLESYHGTYQSMSPMPSPLLLASHGPGAEIRDISPIGSDDERGGKKRNRRARFHDPEEDARSLADALRGSGPPKTHPLIEVLPGLTHEQIMELRTDYKRLVKTGPERKGVNVAKHIRARLKDEDPSLMKACYATALGKWESEAYWANFWYQGDKTRRELLIESLMGRTNAEIRAIKDGFSDKKYDNSLTKCMKTELKEDKFKKAVLMVLEENRMEEYDHRGHPLQIDPYLVEDDVKALRKAVKAEKGGESAMIQIVVMRSDSHLRKVLREYNEEYGSNFARDALKKSGNLVGELLAHILNGVINKPVRDALLVHHALTASKKDELRRELLISRLVRFHWDRHHMAAIKQSYRERYGRDLSEAVKDGTSKEWGQFCQELCITRMPDDVRKVERIEIKR